jgi:Meiotically Up-regulated Gene 113 (MUG113) protein
MSGYVYLGMDDVRPPSGTVKLIKIGKANNVTKREGQIQKMNPSFRVIVALLCDNPLDVEKQVHRGLRDHRYDGEWFFLTPELIELICRVLGRPIPLEQIKREFEFS